MELKVRYFIERTRKAGPAAYYWHPPKDIQARFDVISRRLADDLPRAIAQAQALNRELDDQRAGITAPTPERREGSIPWLVRQFQKSRKYAKIAKATQTFYDKNFRIIERWSAAAGHPHINSIRRKACEEEKEGR